jgi:UDP-glucose 4-epimerase
MRVLITGVAGFLGSHLADAMLKEGFYVVGVDNLLGGYRDNIPDRVRWHNIDCCNWVEMDQAMKGVDLVYHCAATAYEGLSVFSPSIVSRNIMDASTTVFSTAIANKVKRIVHCSSMARYGSILTPYKENMVPRPQDPYGIAKLAAEQMLINLCETHGVEYNIAVPHNIIGPRQKYDDPYRNVASIMMNLMMQGRAPVIYGDGEQQRCFSYVEDCVDCLMKLAFDGVKGQIINIGPDENPVTINELYRNVASVVQFEGKPTYMPGRPQEVKVALCSSTKARRLLGYETKTTLYDGLLKMYNWMHQRGAKKFSYHLPIEIVNEKTPETWAKRLF